MWTSKPEWLKIRAPTGRVFEDVKELLQANNLNTVCQSAQCPNRGRCWNNRTATFLLMGDVCTRECRFCASKTKTTGAPLDAGEVERIAKAVSALKLGYVVLTSVCRDDLPSGGAGHFAKAITMLKKQGCVVEALIPDFNGNTSALNKILAAKPDVIGHNVETVQRLQGIVRYKGADYQTPLDVLTHIKKSNPDIVTKSSLMLGLGETQEEILSTIKDLRTTGVDILTLGQYLSPGKEHTPVAKYLSPEMFEYYRQLAMDMGFKAVASGPFVRSSYKARELFNKL